MNLLQTGLKNGLRKTSLKTLKNRAWKVFSKYTRQKNTNRQGYAKCFTCGIVKRWQEMDAGHYIHGKLDFDERNINPQCRKCNRFLHGNLGIYAERLVKKYGLVEIESLRKLANQKGNRYSRTELEEILANYETKKP